MRVTQSQLRGYYTIVQELSSCISRSEVAGRVLERNRMGLEFTAEQRRVHALARELAEGPLRLHAAPVDIEERYPEEGLRAVADAGLCGLNVPRAFGGLEADAVSSCPVVEQLARGCASTGALLLTWTGGVLAISAFGTAEQKDRWFPGWRRAMWS